MGSLEEGGVEEALDRGEADEAEARVGSLEDEEGELLGRGEAEEAVSARMEAIAMNSACRVPFKVLLVAFMPRPMILPLCTKTQPTGVSSVARASSACVGEGMLAQVTNNIMG